MAESDYEDATRDLLEAQKHFEEATRSLQAAKQARAEARRWWLVVGGVIVLAFGIDFWRKRTSRSESRRAVTRWASQEGA